jgi:hypothetical protein
LTCSSTTTDIAMQKSTRMESIAPNLDDLLNDGRLERLFSKDGRHCALQLWVLQIKSEQLIENRIVYGRLLPYNHSNERWSASYDDNFYTFGQVQARIILLNLYVKSSKTVSRAKPSVRAPPDVAAVLGRLLRPEDADSGERRLHLTMNGTRIFALERLVAHFGLSKRAVIERLIDWADDTLSRSLYEDEAAFNHYRPGPLRKNNAPTGVRVDNSRRGRRCATVRGIAPAARASRPTGLSFRHRSYNACSVAGTALGAASPVWARSLLLPFRID